MLSDGRGTGCGVDLHLVAGLDVLQALDHHPLAGGQALADDPAVALGAAQDYLTVADAGLLVDHQHLRHAGAVAQDGALRHAQALGLHRLLQAYAHVAAGQQVEVRVGELAAQGDLVGAGVDADVGKQQLARQRVGAAVVLDQGGAGLAVAYLLQLASTQGAAQGVQLTGRLSDIGMDRVQLLDGRQRGGLVLPDQRAFGDLGAADTAGDRRGHSGVTEVQASPLQGCFGFGHCSVGLQEAGFGVVVFLAADGLVIDQLAVALLLQARLVQGRLGLGQGGAGAVMVGLERRRVDQEQYIALFDVAAFAVHPLEHHASDPRAHFGGARGQDTAA